GASLASAPDGERFAGAELANGLGGRGGVLCPAHGEAEEGDLALGEAVELSDQASGGDEGIDGEVLGRPAAPAVLVIRVLPLEELPEEHLARPRRGDEALAGGGQLGIAVCIDAGEAEELIGAEAGPRRPAQMVIAEHGRLGLEAQGSGLVAGLGSERLPGWAELSCLVARACRREAGRLIGHEAQPVAELELGAAAWTPGQAAGAPRGDEGGEQAQLLPHLGGVAR